MTLLRGRAGMLASACGKEETRWVRRRSKSEYLNKKEIVRGVVLGMCDYFLLGWGEEGGMVVERGRVG